MNNVIINEVVMGQCVKIHFMLAAKLIYVKAGAHSDVDQKA